jgi:hypothetical protein
VGCGQGNGGPGFPHVPAEQEPATVFLRVEVNIAAGGGHQAPGVKVGQGRGGNFLPAHSMVGGASYQAYFRRRSKGYAGAIGKKGHRFHSGASPAPAAHQLTSV